MKIEMICCDFDPRDAKDRERAIAAVRAKVPKGAKIFRLPLNDPGLTAYQDGDVRVVTQWHYGLDKRVGRADVAFEPPL